MKRRVFAVGLVAVLILVVAPAVYAEGPAPSLVEGIRGNGELHAWGDGLAGVRGDGEVTVTGNGILYFRDHNGDAEWSVSGHGERRDLPSGWVIYYGFDGVFEAEGSRITVALSGYDVELWAQGTGVAVLRGNGEYEINNQRFQWTAEFEPIQLGQP